MFASRKSVGLTRTDVMMILVTIGVMMALALPAIQAAREAARRNNCTGNLKIIGLAIHNHHDTKKALPLLSTAPTVVGQTPGPFPQMYQTPGSCDATDLEASAGYSWIVKVLPFMEQQVLYEQIRGASDKFSTAAFAPHMTPSTTFSEAGVESMAYPGPENPHFSQIHISTLRCPSSCDSDYSERVYSTPGTFTGYTTRSGGAIHGAAVGNYVATTATHIGCMSMNVAPVDGGNLQVTEEPPNGILIPATLSTRTAKLGLNFKAIIDGLSKTLMVTETREPDYSAWYDGTVNWVVSANPGTTGTNQSGNANVGGYCMRLTRPANTAQNSFWTCYGSKDFTGQGQTSLNIGNSPYPKWAYMDESTSRSTNGVCGPPSYVRVANGKWTWGPSSYHSGGVILHLYGDGSVKNVTDDVDANLYIELTTRAGNEPMVPFCQNGDWPATTHLRYVASARNNAARDGG
jgi:hypothetical protein